MTLLLVRHGRPLIAAGVPSAAWELDPSAFDDVWALRARVEAEVAHDAVWFSSPEPKARQTAELLTDGDVGVLAGLQEQERGASWAADFPGAVRRAFDRPDRPAVEGWETARVCHRRVRAALAPVLATHGPDGDDPRDVVLVGHGTAWTLLLEGPDAGAEAAMARWASWAMPDLRRVDVGALPA